jgi:NTE family protein
MNRGLSIVGLLLLLSGCASFGVVQNEPLSDRKTPEEYSIRSWSQAERTNDITLVLAFSGGGTRAAALSYGVLKELRDTKVTVDGRSVRLLDEIDVISSVSGGSFTSAYYGLYGERLFVDFEKVFLRQNIQQTLLDMLFNPFRWFSSTGRTNWAVEYYQAEIFHGATFADMIQPNRPLIVINTSDLGTGVRFSFVQEYFDLICSDLTSFPVARAVAASSAVPVLFNPIVVENYPGCDKLAWVEEARRRGAGNPRMTEVVDGLEMYGKKEVNKYPHFVDGGITDNLGLLAMYDVVQVAGGARLYLQKVGRKPPRQLAVVSVNASTDEDTGINATLEQPGLGPTVNSMSSIQLHRYNIATVQLMQSTLAQWAKELSTPERPVTATLIQLSFDQLAPERRKFFSQIPTSFALTDEQVAKLIEVGGELLRNNPNFQQLLREYQ